MPPDSAKGGLCPDEMEALANNGTPEPEDGEQWPPSRAALAISDSEYNEAKLTPKCIVERYLYADVAQLFAPGKVGKTTAVLYEAVHIVLGWPLWGLRVFTPGWVLLVTKEDQRERLVARTREICDALDLSDEDRAKVLRDLCILDVTGTSRKLVTLDGAGNIVATTTAERIAEAYRADPPVLIVIDPLISFGAAESRVNDNEDALVTAARRLVRELQCCVRFVHHTGQASARADMTDQYSGRGGTALADGCRMTSGLKTWNRKDPLPPGCTDGPGVAIFRLDRHALSYAPPDLPVIWIRREGYRFEHFCELRQTPEQRADAQMDQLERYLTEQHRQGAYWTKRALESNTRAIGMTKRDIAAALSNLEATGRVFDAELPASHRQGGRTHYKCPANCAKPSCAVEPDSDLLQPKTAPLRRPITTAPPIGGGTVAQYAPTDPPQSTALHQGAAGQFGAVGAVEEGESIRAHLAGIGETDPDTIREALTDPSRRAFWLAQARSAARTNYTRVTRDQTLGQSASPPDQSPAPH